MAKDPKQQGLRGSLGAYRLGFRHKIATHDLLSYAMQHPTEHLSTITTDELRHGGMMAPLSLMPTAVADLLAHPFFEFVLNHNLVDTLVTMSAQQLHAIAIFLRHLQGRLVLCLHLDLVLDLPHPQLQGLPQLFQVQDQWLDHHHLLRQE